MLFIAIAHAAEEVATEATSSGIGAIGLDVRSLIFQIINFTILFLLLKKFAFKPIVNMLEQRKATIDESIKNAKEIEQAKASMMVTQDKVIREARAEAQNIIKESKQQANEIIHAAEAAASESAKRTIEQAQSKIAQETQLAKNSLKQEILGLVAAATEKIIKQKLTPESDEKLLNETLSSINE